MADDCEAMAPCQTRPRADRRDRAREARWNARTIQTRIGVEIRDGRLAAGVSQGAAGAAVGMSHAQFGRIERGVLSQLTVEQLSRACAAIGLKLVVRAYPNGEPVRDAAHAALIGRLRACVPASVRVRTEVPLPISGDRRAWDAVLSFPEGAIAVEAETRLRDVQALERRIALKQRDGSIDRVILLVNETATNRRVLEGYREHLRERFPLAGGEVLRAVRSGRMPTASGALLL
jgi:transcriptional regulator with XRE-family HTH domain